MTESKSACEVSERPLMKGYWADTHSSQDLRDYHLALEFHKMTSLYSEECVTEVLRRIGLHYDSSLQRRVQSFFSVMQQHPQFAGDLVTGPELQKRFPGVTFNGSLDQMIIGGGAVFNGNVTVEGDVLIFGPMAIGPDVTIQGDVVLMGGIAIAASTVHGRIEGEEIRFTGGILEATGRVQGNQVNIGDSAIAGLISSENIRVTESILERGSVARGNDQILEKTVLYQRAVVSGNENILSKVTLGNNARLEGSKNHLQQTSIGNDADIEAQRIELIHCQIPFNEELDLVRKQCKGDPRYTGRCRTEPAPQNPEPRFFKSLPKKFVYWPIPY